MGSAEARQSPPASAKGAEGERTPGDATALLVELGRLLKGRQFYPERHPLLQDIFTRGFRAFEAEIRRAGPIELEIRQGSFRLAGEPVGRGRVDDLAQELVKRAIRLLRFDGSLTPAALERFAATLAQEPERLEQGGGFLHVLYQEPCPGVLVNEMNYAAAMAQAGASGGAPPGGGAEGGSAEMGAGGAGLDDLAAAGGLGSGAEGMLGLSGADPGEAVAGALGLLAGEEKPEPLAQQLERSPLDAESGDDRAGALVTLLRELDATTDESRYLSLAREAAVRGAALADDGVTDEGYRAILVLASHASDRARSDGLRGMALECLRELARGARLDDLIARACAPGEGASLRAAQLLLQLGASAVPTLLRRVETEQDLDRRGQLFGVLIAMGEATTPELCLAMQSGERRRAGVAVRLAGEMQNAGSVADLATLLAHEDLDLRREAAKALVRVGSPEAVEALVSALSSPHEGMPGHAAFCLGVVGGTRALQALLAVAKRDGSAESIELAREAVRGLGRMGRPEAVPELARLLDKRSLFRRKRLRELQLAVIAALSKLPGDAARAALEQAAGRGDREIREAAKQAVGRISTEPADPTASRSEEA
jgi:HEAT repeat protein